MQEHNKIYIFFFLKKLNFSYSIICLGAIYTIILQNYISP